MQKREIMLKWLKKNRDAIVITVVAAIALEIVKSYSLNIIDSILALGVPVVGFVVDKIYVLSAEYSVASMSRMPSDLIITLMCSVLFGWALGLFYIDWHGKKYIPEDFEYVVVESQENASGNSSKKKVGLSRRRKFRIMLVICGLIIYIVYMVGFFIPGENYSLFERNMTAIHPYIEETEYNQLFSKWVMMRGEADFSLIKKRIEAVKKDNNLGEYKF